jgi:cellulose synthase/poly-beta-1,6-N-acetylglucosamine synthase-like glycosyltransferase
MSLFPDPISQLLCATTLSTGLSTLFLFPRIVRASCLQGVILVLVVLLSGEIAAWCFHRLWLIPAVAALPLFAGLIRGRVFAPWAAIHAACVVQSGLVLLLDCATFMMSAPNLCSGIVGGIVWFLQVMAVLGLMSTTFDILNVLGRASFPEKCQMLLMPDPTHWPAICVQVPASNEPAELLAQTIRNILRQDYPGRWMVQVIDNNTAEPSIWRPMQQLCQKLGNRVQFLHLENWPGYKAGALNAGTRRLPAWVEVIAVVDADYLVKPDFLRKTARHFADPAVGFVQTPQRYRGWRGAPYFEGLNAMYASFFAISMISRRELGACVCFGGMFLVRRSALSQIGGWDEESITEDVELSLRLLAWGWRGVYDHRGYGAGLMPYDFRSLKRQRFRWAFGMIQCLKKHWRLLLGLPGPQGSSLTLAQRWCFLVLGLQYLAEVPPFLFAFLLVIVVLMSALGSPLTLPALSVALCAPLLLCVLTGARMTWALRETTCCTPAQAMGALVFSLSLSWITACACLAACIQRKGIFLRTPKSRGRQKWQRAGHACAQELVLSLGYLSMIMLAMHHHLLQQELLLVPFLLQAGMCMGAVICAFAAEGIWLLPRFCFGGWLGTISPLGIPHDLNKSRLGEDRGCASISQGSGGSGKGLQIDREPGSARRRKP